MDRMKTAILTDTNSGIMEHEAESLGIYVVPMPVIVDGQVLFEGEELTDQILCSYIQEGREIRTSQPSPGEVAAVWDKLLDMGYEEIVYIPMSSGLSSACRTAELMVQDYEEKVYVVDNHRISVTQRMSVLRAYELAKRGISGQEIKRILELEAKDSSIYIALDSLDQIKRGGRITAAGAAVVSALGIKPVLTIQGEKLDAYAVARGSMKRCEKKMAEGLKHDLRTRFQDAQADQIYIGAAGFGMSPEDQNCWTDLLEQEFPGTHVFYNPLPVSIGVHTGPNAVGVGITIMKKEEL